MTTRSPDPTTPTSDFEQIGGAPTVRRAVERFYDLVLADPDLAPYFVDVDIPKLKRHQVLLLTQVLGGPTGYDGRDLADAHWGLGITDVHYTKVVNHLAGVLTDLGAPEDTMTRVASVLAELKSKVVNPATDPSGGSR